jgi:hypothetical protein
LQTHTAKQCRQIPREHFVHKKLQNVLPNICLYYFASGVRTLQKGRWGLTEKIPLLEKQSERQPQTYNGGFGASGALSRVDNSERKESFILSRASDVESPACRQAPGR